MVRNDVGGLRYLEDDVRTDDFETLSATQVDEIVSSVKSLVAESFAEALQEAGMTPAE